MAELSDGLESDERMNHVFETSSSLMDGLSNIFLSLRAVFAEPL
jgi:hypothetical protein